ncbi:copper homeostasis protein CutC [Flavobacteriaceae bacterium]|jgi:copper homeostasis protein|nr:copper homeostasis protein CutC [Flavobacteriaceae bacterium]HCD22786.1 copper homeostasis protein CutC [Flavobacteriaceae bacterium]
MEVEVCAHTIASALTAQQAGVQRIELCSAIGVGGVTPSFGVMEQVRRLLRIPIHVLIRPRMGDFTYTHHEFASMISDISLCRSLGFEGVVFGVLTKDTKIDQVRTRQLLYAAQGMKCTFHRAIDWVDDPVAAVSLLEDLGIDTVLSSGGASTAMEGLATLERMQLKSKKMTVMPGSGVKPDQIMRFKSAGFRAIHLSGIVPEQVLESPPKVPLISPNLMAEQYQYDTSAEKIRQVCEVLRKL